MHFGIIGAGATGAYLAARLAKAGTRVTLAARGRSASAIADHGIFVSDDAGTWNARPAQVWDTSTAPTPEEAPDVIMVCVKTYDTEAVLPVVARLGGPDTLVLSLQNGMRADDLLAREFGATHVCSGVLYVGAHRTGAGRVECTAPPRVLIGPYETPTAGKSAAEGVAGPLSRAGIECSVEKGILTAKWQKFLFNCGLNPLTALTGQKMGTILANSVLEGIFRDLVTEAARVGEETGAPLAPDAVEQAMTTARRMDISSSMAEDRAAGRPLELDAFSGHVLSLAEPAGIPVPATQVVHALLSVSSNLPKT